VQEAAHPEANIIFGAVIDDALGDEVRVTVIAAGFDGGAPTRRRDDRALGQVTGRSSGPAPATPPSIPASPSREPSYTPSQPQPAMAQASGQPAYPSHGSGYTHTVSAPPVQQQAPATSGSSSQRNSQQEPESGDWQSAEERQREREAPAAEPLTPPRVVELPDPPRPGDPRQSRSPRPVLLDDDDLDVPDFLK
jgi:cell division protein FtsZ